DVLWRWEGHTAQLPDTFKWSHKKIRNYLILAFFATGLVLLGTNYAFHTHGSAFANSQSVYGVAFEGAVHPASEVRITAESTGMVSDISVQVGDTVQDRKSTRLNSSHRTISYAVFCLKKKKKKKKYCILLVDDSFDLSL